MADKQDPARQTDEDGDFKDGGWVGGFQDDKVRCQSLSAHEGEDKGPLDLKRVSSML
jgi:hypothetical protein